LLNKEIKLNGILKIPSSNEDLFFFLTKTIISQQISDIAARTIWNRFLTEISINKLIISNVKDKNELSHCLKKAGVSQRKILCIIEVFEYIISKKISSKQLNTECVQEIRKSFIFIRGIGNWTIDMLLIFFLKKQNIFPKNDLVISKVVDKIKASHDKELDLTKIFTPHLSIFSLHLWKMSHRVLK